MNGQHVYIGVQNNQWMNAFELLIAMKDDRDPEHISVATNIEFEKVDVATILPDDSRIHVDKECLQRLVDQLWALGIRPTSAEDTRPLVEAKNQHIEDLRKIVFKLMGDLK